MVPPPTSRGKENTLQPPIKRRKKPASNSEGAAPWETTRVFQQQKSALPTIQLNGVVARGAKGPSLKAPANGPRQPSASASVPNKAFVKRQDVPTKQATKDSGVGLEKKSMLARSKSLSRLRAKPVSSGTAASSSSAASASTSLRRKRSSANLLTTSSGKRHRTDESGRQQTQRKNDRVQGDQQPLKARAVASKDGIPSSATSIGNANSAKNKTIKPAMEGKIKAQIASLATRIVTDPHENVGNLSQLRQIAIQNRGRLAALTILTEAQVYRDIAPGYRIRTVTEKEAAVKVSKEVAQLRSFEQSLLSGFRRFIKSCTSLSQWRATGNSQTLAAKDMTEVRHAACKALSTILAALPHFNEADAIATAVVDFASDRDEAVRTLAKNALTEVLSNAHKASGPVAQTCITAAKALADAAEGRKARVVSEETLAPLSEINFAAFARLPIGKQQKGQHNGKGDGGKKLSKRKREMLAAKNRKRPKDEEEMAASEKADADLDRDIAEAEADATPQETVALRKALLDAVCTACFNVIKTASADVIDDDAKKKSHKDIHANSKRTRKPPPALSSALRGLLRVARYVGPDVIDAIVAALIPMLERGPYPLALRLRCATVAYEIVTSRNVATAAATTKAAAANNRSDPTVFETDAAALDSSLYGMLVTLCGAHEVRLLDEDTVILDLLETLYAATSSRRLPAARAAAMARRVAIVATASAGTHGSTAGLLKSAQALFDSSMTMPVSLVLKQLAGSSFDNNADDSLDVCDEDDEKEGMQVAGRKGGFTQKQQQRVQKRREDAIAELGLIDEFDLSAHSADAASAARSIAWELAALVDHFHPTVRLIAQQCIDGMCGDRLPKKSHDDNPVVVARRHTSDDGGFNPLPQERLLYQQYSGEKKKHQARADDTIAVNIEHDAVVARLYAADDAGRKQFVHFGESSGLVNSSDVGLEEQQQDDEEDAYVDWCDGYFGRVFEDYHLNNDDMGVDIEIDKNRNEQ